MATALDREFRKLERVVDKYCLVGKEEEALDAVTWAREYANDFPQEADIKEATYEEKLEIAQVEEAPTSKPEESKQTKLIVETNEDEGGIMLDKEDVQLIYNALNSYKPTEKEDHVHSVLLEQFEEILVVDYNEPYPNAN